MAYKKMDDAYRRKIVKKYDDLVAGGMLRGEAGVKVGHDSRVIKTWRDKFEDGEAEVTFHESKPRKYIRRPQGKKTEKSDKMVAVIGTPSEIADMIKGM